MEHFEFYTSLSTDVSRAVAAAKRRYGQAEDADLHVTISHRKRRTISTAKQAQAALGRPCISIPASDDEPGFLCFAGTKLVGNSTAGRVINGARYIVTSICPERVALKDLATNEEFGLTPEGVSRLCILGWALVYPRIQGCTETGTILLHDMNSKYLRRHHLFVGLSRVTDGRNAFISPE